MQTKLSPRFADTPEGREADRILRACVHCGFCNASCPTYQVLGDELDGPRGRIYLMKQMLEGHAVSADTRQHLDRCLTCRNCETTCPSGVRYGRLIDIGRELIEQLAPRSLPERALRTVLRRSLLTPILFRPLLHLGRALRPALPSAARRKVPTAKPTPPRTTATAHRRRMLLLEGCMQPDLAPEINARAKRVLDHLGISLIAAPEAGCCGALSQHMAAVDEARAAMRRNIDAWWPHVEAGLEAIVMTASGCGATVRDYGYHLRDDPSYAEKAARIAALTLDLSEALAREDLSGFTTTQARRIAFHPPCSLQHGQQVRGVIEDILSRLGYELVPFDEAHLCCGSAGSYSLLQPNLAAQLRDRKLSHIESQQPELIASANIGCQLHLASGTDLPVVHWIELLNSD